MIKYALVLGYVTFLGATALVAQLLQIVGVL